MWGGGGQFGRMKFSELMQSAYLIPAARGAGIGLVLFLAVWWRERRSGGFALLALGLAWVLCHLVVNANSYLFPPKETADWLVFASLGLVPVAVVAWLRQRGECVAAVCAAVLLGAAAWLALHKLSWLLERGESGMQRQLWTAGIVAAVLTAFAAGEAAARKVPAGAMAGALAAFAGLGAFSLLHMAMPERITARLLAVAGLAAGLAVACVVLHLRRRPLGQLPTGMAGWLAGGVVLLFILGCLSRASGVPLLPMAAAGLALPLAVVVLYTGNRLLGGSGRIFSAALVLAGAVLVWLAMKDVNRPVAAPAATAPTGADDTGAYD